MSDHEKDANRFSFSRFSKFHVCPRQHHYAYVEQIESEAVNAFTKPGGLFHEAIEKFLKDEDMNRPIEEFRDLCRKGELEMEPDTLEAIVKEYLQYYRDDYAMENTLLVEHKVEDYFDEKHYLSAYIDQAYEREGMVVVRDLKTTTRRLKYTHDNVETNQQLLLYAAYAEQYLGRPIDAIEIDEVKLAKMGEVPITNSGKVSIDKRKLDGVTYDMYYEELCERGLEDDKNYQDILDWLKKRGHPLFNRVRVQVLNKAVLKDNVNDLYNTYEQMVTGKVMYRVRGPLCNYCDYKELCKLDMHAPTDADRKILIDRISGKLKSK